MKLYTSKVPRKGKGKGIQEIESFGIPVLNQETKLAEKFDYTFLHDKTIKEIIDGAEQSGKFTAYSIKESIVTGLDNTLRSITKREEIAVSELTKWLLDQDLAQDEQDASNVAISWNTTREFQKRNFKVPYTNEELAAGRKVYVDQQKALGLWKVRLINKELENKTIADVLASATVAS